VDVKESYKILRLSPGAGLDEIKASYRRLAFKLHPDLNPDDPKAAENFQRLNEAYVILREAVQGESQFESSRVRRAREKAREADRARRKEKAEKQASREKSRSRAAGPPPGAGKSARSGPPGGPGPAAGKSSHSPPGGSARPGPGSPPPPGSHAGKSAGRPKRDVIRNIMNDPFARKVFDEIYSHIRSGDTKPPSKVKKRQVSLKWGDKEMKVDLSQGVYSGMKGWFRRQFDDEQTIYLSPSQLMPGSRLKLNIRRAWTGKPVTVELPLPRDYIVGRPLRLKGLGRQFGPFKGDLYLRLLAK
jgi:molecular chaperone DnaJ